MTPPAPLLRERWPEFAGELRHALVAGGRDDLAAQVGVLRVVRSCGCGDDCCQSFHTGPPPDGAYGPGHANVVLEAPWAGELILDVVDGRIVFVEVLYRVPLA